MTAWKTSFEEGLQDNDSRLQLHNTADVLIKKLESYIDEFIDKHEKQMDKNAVKTVQRCNKVIEDIRATRELAAATPPAAIAFESKKVKRSLGFLVVVEDANSLAWVRCHPVLRFQCVELLFMNAFTTG